MLANEWDTNELNDWGVSVPEFPTDDDMDEDEIERKEREFRERMAAGEISEEDEEYQEFLEKFKLKKTTDDCYTPAVVYDAVAGYVAKTYGVNRRDFVRPFYPGGDYQKEQYPDGCVVVDNPPFSILAEIMQFYAEKKIPFFLFAPSLTLFSSSSSSSNACAIPCGVGITYENGACVSTSFVTSFESDTIRVKTCPELYQMVKEANDKNLAEMRKELPKYNYPLSVITSAALHPYSRLGIEFVIPKKESMAISQLDAQKEMGKAIYGKGYLISDRLKAEREKAEREKAEREKAEREKAYVFELSDKEHAIIAKLNR